MFFQEQINSTKVQFPLGKTQGETKLSHLMPLHGFRHGAPEGNMHIYITINCLDYKASKPLTISNINQTQCIYIYIHWQVLHVGFWMHVWIGIYNNFSNMDVIYLQLL